MAALTVKSCGRAGGSNLGTLENAGATGDTLPAGPDMFLRVKNGNAAACTVTVTPSAGGGPLGTTIAPLAMSPQVEASTGERIYGPFPASPFADASDGLIHVSYSVTTTVTVQALRMPI